MAQITIPSLGPIGTVSGQSFTQKLIETKIAIAAPGTGTQPTGFSSSLGGNTLTISDARTSARITYAGGLTLSQAEVSIWGLAQSLMNELQTLGKQINEIKRNQLTLLAGDAISGLSTVFTGEILEAYGDYNAAPDVAMKFFCQAGAADMVVPLKASSFTGPTDVVAVMSQIAQLAGWGFLNNFPGGAASGIVLNNPTFNGSPVEQMRKAKAAANINAQLFPGTTEPISGGPENQPYVLAIWPRNGFRPPPGGIIPVISPQTGMVGYPNFATQTGINVRTLYNPAILFGGQISVQSSLFTNQSLVALANPTSLWTVYRLDHALDALVPKGEWVSSIYAAVSNPQFPTLPPS